MSIRQAPITIFAGRSASVLPGRGRRAPAGPPWVVRGWPASCVVLLRVLVLLQLRSFAAWLLLLWYYVCLQP